jgi:hypothetical protein
MPMAQRTKMVLSSSEFLTTVNGSPEIAFSSGNNYYNVSNISSLSDFTEQSDSYIFFKINKIVLDIVRTTDEATMVSKLRGGDIYLGYYPHYNTTSVTYSDLSRNVNSYRIDPMTFDEQKVVIIIPDLLGYRASGGVDYWLNLSKHSYVGFLQYATGEIAIRTSNTTNNDSVTLLFKIKIKIHIEFSHRI